MKNNFFCINSSKYLYEKPSHKSKISSEILYGEKFKILSKNKDWIKKQQMAEEIDENYKLLERVQKMLLKN